MTAIVGADIESQQANDGTAATKHEDRNQRIFVAERSHYQIMQIYRNVRICPETLRTRNYAGTPEPIALKSQRRINITRNGASAILKARTVVSFGTVELNNRKVNGRFSDRRTLQASIVDLQSILPPQFEHQLALNVP